MPTTDRETRTRFQSRFDIAEYERWLEALEAARRGRIAMVQETAGKIVAPHGDRDVRYVAAFDDDGLFEPVEQPRSFWSMVSDFLREVFGDSRGIQCYCNRLRLR